MGLLDALGYGSNPFVSWLDQNRNTISSGFGGLAGASNLHDALTGLTRGINDPNAAAMDTAYGQTEWRNAAAKLQTQQQQEAQNATIKFLQANAPHLVPLAQSGDVAGAFNAYLQYRQAHATGAYLKSKGGSPQMADMASAGGISPSDAINLATPKPLPSYSSGMYTPLTGQTQAMDYGTGIDPIGSIADGIKNGTMQPTILSNLPRGLSSAVASRLAADGYDLAGANLDYKGAVKRTDTLNGVSFTRLTTAIDTTAKSLDIIDNLADQWRGLQLPGGTSLPALNKANLAAAKQGLYGQQAMSIATQLEGQIHDSAAEIGSVFRNGNTPTDQAMQQASTQLDSNWSTDTLHDMTNIIRLNMNKRLQSFKDAAVDPSNPYMQGPAATAPQLKRIDGVDYISTDGGQTWYTQ